jgi:hypothetical protein
MEFVNKELRCKFSLPEPLRMKHVEQYEGARNEARAAGAQFAASINWVGAVTILEDWVCEDLPDPKALTPEDLGDVHGPALQVVVWVAGQVAVHVMKQLFVPKN